MTISTSQVKWKTAPPMTWQHPWWKLSKIGRSLFIVKLGWFWRSSLKFSQVECIFCCTALVCWALVFVLVSPLLKVHHKVFDPSLQSFYRIEAGSVTFLWNRKVNLIQLSTKQGGNKCTSAHAVSLFWSVWLISKVKLGYFSTPLQPNFTT